MKRLSMLICLLVALLLCGCSGSSASALYDDYTHIAAAGNSYNLSDARQIAQGATYQGSMRFEGTGTLWQYEATQAETITCTFSLSVDQGRAKLVWIDPDGQVGILAENNATRTQTITFPVSVGVNRIKLVGADQAEVTVQLALSAGLCSEIGF